MTTEENLTKSKVLLQSAIISKEKTLFPTNPLFTVSQSTLDREITIKEQVLLKCLLTQFEKMFPEGE